MSQLSAQSIADLCMRDDKRMILPFVIDKQIVNGKSFGLSAASYDLRIATGLTLGVHPGLLMAQELLRSTDSEDYYQTMKTRLHNYPSYKAVVRTVEKFHMPANVVGYICDKSSYARIHVTAFNTLFDPGFRGTAMLELVNLGDTEVVIQPEDPICQIAFHWLDERTIRPYDGKYQDQEDRIVGMRYEHADGVFTERDASQMTLFPVDE
jgi:deoxycytidine triphosphate deaminase